MNSSAETKTNPLQLKNWKPAKLRRRIRQLETCLEFVEQWASDQYFELRSLGADRDDNSNYKALVQLRNRINRTL